MKNLQSAEESKLNTLLPFRRKAGARRPRTAISSEGDRHPPSQREGRRRSGQAQTSPRPAGPEQDRTAEVLQEPPPPRKGSGVQRSPEGTARAPVSLTGYSSSALPFQTKRQGFDHMLGGKHCLYLFKAQGTQL